MLIDLNGMNYHLNVTPSTAPPGVRVALVDEAFQCAPRRATVDSLAALTRFIETCTGVMPPPEVTEAIARHFDGWALAA